MPQRPLLNAITLALASAFGAGPAWSLGFGQSQPSATLGAPLDFRVPIRLDDGETLPSECVSAEVSIGDVTLPRSGVGASLESSAGTRSIRVRTLARIDEPVVNVTVTAGCTARVSRRFTLFADPPGLPATLPTLAATEPGREAPPVRAATAAPPREAPVASGAARLPARADSTARAPAGNTPPRESKPPAARASSAEPAVAAAEPARKPRAALGPAEGPGARLRLDAPAVTFAADQAAREAAERRSAELAAVRAAVGLAHAAASAASTRVASMESAVETLKKESRANREAMAQLRQSLAEADERGRWTPWLLAAVLGLLGIAGWLYARLRNVETERREAWWNSSAVAEAGAAAPAGPGAVEAASAVPTSGPEAIAATATAKVEPPQGPPATVADAAVPASQATQPLPPGAVAPDMPVRDVSIEELLDVEQQAEFFIVLGQDDAAVDLLMGHLRSSGGASPLPYLKLLEIYHRRGDAASYERIRRRFNDRFNAVAPDWATGLQSGRSLADYPEVIARIQQVWSSPIDAMAELETLLFRKRAADLFDLPAYRDVLFLYTLARDLQEMAQHDAARVDVLLPLGGTAAVVDDAPAAPGADRPTQPDSLSMELIVPPTLMPPDTTRPAPLEAASSGFGELTLEPRQIS